MNELPIGWSVARLAEVTNDIAYGFTTASTMSGVLPKLLRITDIQDGAVNWNTVPRCKDAPNERVFLSTGDIVTARTGATTGKSYLIENVPEKAVFASYLIRVRLGGQFEPRYAWAFMQSDDYWSQIQNISKGTAQPGANASILSELRLPVSPLPEQRRIVAKLDSLSAKSKRARDHLDHIPRLVEKYKQAVLAAELSPEGRAEVKKVGDIAALLNGDRGREYPGDHEQLPTGHCLFLGTRNVRQGHFDFSETSFISEAKHGALRGGTMKRGDIVITVRGTLGNCAVYDSSVSFEPVRINSAMMIMRPTVSADPQFLMWAIRSPVFMGWVGANARGSAQPHLRGKDIEETFIYFPPIDEQKAAVRRIHTAFTWIDRFASEASSAGNLINRLDQAVLAKAFRGELVPQDPADEPAIQLLEGIRAERAGQTVKGQRVRKLHEPGSGGRRAISV